MNACYKRDGIMLCLANEGWLTGVLRFPIVLR